MTIEGDKPTGTNTISDVEAIPSASAVATEPESITAVPIQIDSADADELVKKPIHETSESESIPSTTRQQHGRRKFKTWLIVGAVVILTVIVVTLSLLLTAPTYYEPPQPPTTVTFATGVSIITDYAVDTKVRSRLATTNLTMEVRNGMNCSSVHVVTLQLPFNTRVASLKTIADDGCHTNGQVKAIEEARDTFVEQTSQGLSSTYVEQQDGFTYTVQVSMPPYGKTIVELMVEQLLQQKRGEIAFEIPLMPNEDVDSLIFDLTVDDVEGRAVGFNLDLDLPGISSATNVTNGTSHFHLDLHDTRQHSIPNLLRGKYAPGVIPENGILF
eukprot:scaffold56389_cov75-Cyclotella_meneghiniana.AAC.12